MLLLGAYTHILDIQADIGSSDVLGRQALHHGAQAGSKAVLEFIILNVGVDINNAASKTGTTPLQYAAKVTTFHKTRCV